MSHCHRNLPYLNNCLKSVLVHVNLPLKRLTTKSQSSLFSISVHGCLIASQNLNFCFCSFEIPGESKYSRMSQNERPFLTCVCVLCSVSVFCVLCSVFINCVLKYCFFEHEIKLFTKIKIFSFI